MSLKYIIYGLFFIQTLFANGQKLIPLREVTTFETANENESIIYGNFIQRLGFSSGGFPQHIRLLNLDTNEMMTFIVKPTFSTKKEIPFHFFIKPGKYAIVNYWWTESKWYGGKTTTENIFKNFDSTKSLSNEMTNELEHYTFIIEKNTVNYLGTWNFRSGFVSFSNDKNELDVLLKKKLKKIDFTTSIINLPF